MVTSRDGRGRAAGRPRVVLLVAVAGWLVPGALLGVPTVGAQTTPPRPAVVPGAARTDAQAYKFAIGLTGSVSSAGQLGLSRGTQTTTASDLLADATSVALDLGLIANLDYRYPPDCPPVPPKFAAATMPKATYVQSSDPAAAASRPTEVRWPGGTASGEVAGVQDATAGPDLRSAAATVVGDVVGPFLTATGLRSDSSTSLDATGRRVARSQVSATSIDLAGVATIGQPRFTAVSASDGSSSSSFTFDFVYFMGQYRTGADGVRALEDAKAFAEGLYAGLGLKVDLPVGSVVPRTNPSAEETVRIEATLSPLRVRLAKIPLARDLLGPVFTAFAPQIEEIKAQIRADHCADKSLLNVIGVGVDLLSGVGELGTSLGEVSAMTSDAWTAPYEAPPTTAPGDGATPPTVLSATTFPSSPGSGSASSGSGNGSTSVGGGLTTTTESLDSGSTTTVPVTDASTQPRARFVSAGGRQPAGRRGGLLTWVAVGLLGAVVLATGADRFALVRRSVA